MRTAAAPKIRAARGAEAPFMTPAFLVGEDEADEDVPEVLVEVPVVTAETVVEVRVPVVEEPVVVVVPVEVVSEVEVEVTVDAEPVYPLSVLLAEAAVPEMLNCWD
jgi:hypothetical protein